VPPIPAGLKQLSPALNHFVEQFALPDCLVEAAAENSPERPEMTAPDFQPRVARLSREECDGYLCRFAQGDVTAGMELKKQLLALEPQSPDARGPSLSIDELLERAEAMEAARRRRQELDARRKHEAEMKALAECEAETWQNVTSLVKLKQIKNYDQAVQLLAKLAQLAEFRGSQNDYRQKLTELRDRYKRLSGFQWRVEQARLPLVGMQSESTQ